MLEKEYQNQLSKEVRYQRPIKKSEQDVLLWKDKSRPFFGLPLSFTTYSLYEDRLIIKSGLLTRHTEEIRLFRVLDVSLKQSLFQRLFHVGSVKLVTADETAPKFFLHDILDSEDVLRLVSDTVHEQRKINRIGTFESF